MSTLLKVALAALILVFVGCAGLFLLAPSDYEVSRELTIDAPSAKIHSLVEDLKLWPSWSFWDEEYDATLVWSYSGAEKGVGAISSWTGKDGPGGMEITASDPDRGLWFDITFGEGDAEVVSKCSLQYAAAGEGSAVTMSISGSFPGALKLLNWGADAVMGPSFESSLQGLKQAVEAAENSEPVEPVEPVE